MPVRLRAGWLHLPAIEAVLRALGPDSGARFVGGCVRDALIDPAHDPADLDLATPLTPDLVIARLTAAGLPAIPTGLAHGTVTTRAGGRSVEITTLRRDVTTDGRHAMVAFTDDFALDAGRRDFTINAMSCDPDGRLYDYFGGRSDLMAGRVRFVGDPGRRIREDYLRILRFFRFFARLGRPPADPAALAACADERRGLRLLAAERVWSELRRLLVVPSAVASLRLMVETRVWGELLPGPPDIARFERLLSIDPVADPITRLAALLLGSVPGGDEGAGARHIADAVLKLSALERRLLVALLVPDAASQAGADALERGPPPVRSPTEMRQAAYQQGRELARASLALGAADRQVPPAAARALLAAIADWRPPMLPITGDDLLQRGMLAGPRLGDVKRAIERRWIASDFTLDRDQCLALLDDLLAGEPIAPSA